MQIAEVFSNFIDYMNSGGFVMWPLFIANFFMWYGIGYRFHTLRKRNIGSVRRLVYKHKRKKQKKRIKGILDMAINEAIQIKKRYPQLEQHSLRMFLDDMLFKYKQEIKRYSRLVKVIVIVAPLTGLLGTVVGMIETFDSMASMTLFSQTGGIAGGISQALFTTQFGLIVAVPGLIIGRILDKRERNLELEFEQLKDIICSQGEIK